MVIWQHTIWQRRAPLKKSCWLQAQELLLTMARRQNKEEACLMKPDRTDVNRKDDIAPYYKSKAIAEKAAWDFIKNDNSGLELSVVCPGLILGPLLEEDFNASTNAVIKMLDGSLPAVPRIGYEIVDVRSIASLLILAMEQPQAANQRYIGSAGFLTLAILRKFLKRLIRK